MWWDFIVESFYEKWGDILEEINLRDTYLVTETGNERLGKQKLDLVVL